MRCYATYHIILYSAFYMVFSCGRLLSRLRSQDSDFTSCPMPLLLKQAFAPGFVIVMTNFLEFDTNPNLATLKLGEKRIKATVSDGRVYAWLTKAEACLYYGNNNAIITRMLLEADSIVVATKQMEDMTLYQVLVGLVPWEVDVPDCRVRSRTDANIHGVCAVGL